MEWTYGEVLEGTSLLNVSKGRLEVLQLDIDAVNGLLGLGNL